MTAMREVWTDERLDDLNSRVADMGRRMDEGFNRVDTKIDSLRKDVDTKFGDLHRLVLQVGGGMIATLIVGIFSVLATQL